MSFGRSSRGNTSAWLGVFPFLAFCLVFEIVPVLILLRGSFSDKDGLFTLTNYEKISAASVVQLSKKRPQAFVYSGCVTDHYETGNPARFRRRGFR